MKIYKFKNCLLHTLERSVLKDGDFLDVKPKAFDVLKLLVERPGEIISKDEMLGSVWSGTFVEESNLAVHISNLRKLLGSTSSERYIETVHGVGYRWVCCVGLATQSEWELGSALSRTEKSFSKIPEKLNSESRKSRTGNDFPVPQGCGPRLGQLGTGFGSAVRI